MEQPIAELRAALQDLDGWVQARAQQLADARVAQEQALAAARCEAYEQAFAVERERHNQLVAEMRRQIDARDRWHEQHVRRRCVPAEDPGR